MFEIMMNSGFDRLWTPGRGALRDFVMLWKIFWLANFGFGSGLRMLLTVLSDCNESLE